MGISSKMARAKRDAAYFDNYVEYLSKLDDSQPKIGKGEDKPPQTKLYLKPFGHTLTPKQFFAANATTSRWNTYKEKLGTRVTETKEENANVLKIRGFQPARVVIKIGVGAKRVVKAKTTKRDYTTRGGVSGSIPFGITGTEAEVEAYNNIVNAIKGGGEEDKTTRISRVKEVS